MKIMYVEIATTGHRIPYIKALTEDPSNEVVVLLPERVETLTCKQIVCRSDVKNRSFSTHKEWISEILKAAKEESPDVIHFLTGDVFYKFFGFGLNKLKKYNPILTFHSVKTSFLQKISLRVISGLARNLVFHSEFMKNQAESFGIKNAVHIEYPVFGGKSCDKNEAKGYFNLKTDIPVIGCVGGTRYDKGLDILLESLKTVKEPFQLLVAGKEEHFVEAFIKEETATYSENVHLALKFLSDEELMYAMNATDIVVLPYRKMFNGASGPLGEGVALCKCIVGPDHGNLRDTIEKNHLGFTFESENTTSLSAVLSDALKNKFIPDEDYVNYKNLLSVSAFKEGYNKLYYQK